MRDLAVTSDQDQYYLSQAITLARQSVEQGGGPFGAVVVKNDAIIGRGHNQVTLTNDPSAHAEIVAIRDACRQVGDFMLNDSVIYASCEPCPMCYAAIHWSRISRIVFAASSRDAADAGFDDARIASEICLPYERRSIKIEQQACEHRLDSFHLWNRKTDRTDY